MKRAVIYQFGGPEVMQIEDISIPTPSARQVLVKMIATSINGADLLQRRGKIPLGKKFPKTFGIDLVGKIVKVGSKVRDFQIGDLVWGNVNTQINAMAEYVVCSPKNIILVPNGINQDSAAALPTATITAIAGLLDKGHLQKGMRVLIRGIGGVGMIAVQIAHAYGAEVVALGSQNSKLIKQYGANQFFDYHQTAISELGKFDIVFDTVGNDLDQFRRILNAKGKLLTIGTDLDHPIKSILTGIGSLHYGTKRTRFVIGYPNHRRLEKLNQLVTGHHIKPIIDSVYTLNDIVKANERADQHGIFGKIIIKISD